jgi:hypothetical protein
MKIKSATGLGALLLPTILLITASGQAQDVSLQPEVSYEIKRDISIPLREMAKNIGSTPAAFQTLEPELRKHFVGNTNGPDPVVQDAYLPKAAITEGLSFDGTNATGQLGALPPDPNGSAGSTQFVEIVNISYAVYDKMTGALELPPTFITTLWSGFGGLCETNPGGDPVVLWDKLAQRWLVTQLAINSSFTQFMVCIAVSTTDDATGSFARYAYNFGDLLPDYPKYAVWPDAYYFSANEIPPVGKGGAVPCAFDRKAMLAGRKAARVCFPYSPRNFSMLPSDLDGAAPPPEGEPNHYIQLGSNTNTLDEFDFHVDFADPKNSTFTGPHKIAVPSFALLCPGPNPTPCIPEPSPGERLSSLSSYMMFRLAYRNFGDHESMVVANTVKPGPRSKATAATRWYELRSTSPGNPFSVFQAGTFQDDDASLFMASIAMDKAGDIAMGLSAVSPALKPSVWYTGREPDDPAGNLSKPFIAVTGTAVQVKGHNRWGDYSSMSLDPDDDCTFWYTQEYYNHTVGGPASSDWSTHVVSFKFDRCK